MMGYYRGGRSGRYKAFKRPSYRKFAGGVRKPYSYRGAIYGRGGGARAMSRSLRTTNWNQTGEELKYLDINSAAYVCDTTGAVTLINGVAAGSTSITREGRQCFWRSVHVTGALSQVDDTVIGSRCDVFIIWDKQPGAAVPAMNVLFVESIAGSPMNLDYRERFVVLAHESYTIGGAKAAAAAQTPTIHSVNIFKKVNLRTTFKGDNNAIGDIATGAMYLVTLGDQAAANCGSLRASVRLRFSERSF